MTTEFRAKTCRIEGFDAVERAVQLADGTLRMWQVADLERHVDREALLRGNDPAEPPYWALSWTGARALADVVPNGAGAVLELGCGLGLPGLTAAWRGARVVCLDHVRTPLAFVAASARSNDLRHVQCVVGDMTSIPFVRPFDCILAAEILYDRAVFRAIAAEMARLLAPDGVALLADAGRIDTHAFYELFPTVGLRCTTTRVIADEEGWRIPLQLARIERDQPNP